MDVNSPKQQKNFGDGVCKGSCALQIVSSFGQLSLREFSGDGMVHGAPVIQR